MYILLNIQNLTAFQYLNYDGKYTLAKYHTNVQTWQCHECALACIIERAGFISMALECKNNEDLLDAQGQYWQIMSCQSH